MKGQKEEEEELIMLKHSILLLIFLFEGVSSYECGNNSFEICLVASTGMLY